MVVPVSPIPFTPCGRTGGTAAPTRTNPLAPASDTRDLLAFWKSLPRGAAGHCIDIHRYTGYHAAVAGELSEGARLFKALGDQTRLAILRQLREQGEVCACDFVACCEVAQPTVSHHLRTLRAAGLVEAEKRGVWTYYRLNADALGRLRRYLP